ncbi:hypothetical protein AVKW3434_03855 [Acidovorax sp. SUPP3434]|nr:hypothetical protein [Acidovorax sp. SUPP3434]GKS98481.1 hypothetical protein AVKW3434_03855 [Acidovorax sp. SUPP3434]
MEGANKKDMDVYDCIMSGPACSKSSAEMEDMRESARKERIQGMKDIGQGSVDVYKSTPGTLGNGIPGGRIPKP